MLALIIWWSWRLANIFEKTKYYEKQFYEELLIFSFHWGMNEKKRCALPAILKCACQFFQSFLNEMKKNRPSILIIQFQIIFMQNLRENSFEIKPNLNWCESARINLPMVKAELMIIQLRTAIFERIRNVLIQALQTVFICLLSLPFLCVFHLWFKRYQHNIV